MTISVVMPVLDEEGTLPATLAHTASLGFAEVIVADGGSRDRTPDLAAAFAAAHPGRSAYVVSLPGRARQMNAGAKAASGDVLVFLHADTLLPPDAPSAIEQALADPAVVGGRFDVRFDRETRLSQIIGGMMNWRSRRTGIATGDQAIFVRRPVFDRLGGYAEIPLMEDVDFSTRLKRAGRVAALRQQAVTSYRRWEAGGPVRTILLMWTLRSLYWAGVTPRRLSRFYRAVR